MVMVMVMVVLLVSLHRHRDAEVIGFGRHLDGTKSCAARTMQKPCVREAPGRTIIYLVKWGTER
jgi:hypothetical protein